MRWRILTVLTSEELLNKAFHAAGKIKPNNTWERSHPRGTTMKKIDTVSSILQSKLTLYVKKFPSVNIGEVYQGSSTKEGVGRFYYDLFDLTFGVDDMKKSLGSLDWAVKKIRELESQHTKKLKRLVAGVEMDAVRSSFYGRVSSVINQIEKDLKFLAKARDSIRKMPHIDEDAVVVVVAGGPNVGKSSLINMISSGNSQIASYPFTTKGIFLGHITIGRTNLVLVDTPGLLERPESARNPIERKASSAIRNLSSAVIFVMDPSETSGMTLDSQETLVRKLKEELGKVPHITIDNKCDLLRREVVEMAVTETGTESVNGDTSTDDHRNLQVSCETEEGKDAVIEWLTGIVREQQNQKNESSDLPDPDDDEFIIDG